MLGSWQIQSVEVTNLFSYKSASFYPGKSVIALVFGENLDDPGADSNGSGKSSLFDIVTWALWGKTARSENFEADILRRGEKNASVILSLLSSSGSPEKVVISRSKGEKSSLEFIRSTLTQTEKLTQRLPSLTQIAIAKFFGFDPKKGFTDYLSQVYFSTMSDKGFLASEASPQERQEVLERFLDLKVCDSARDLARDELKEIEITSLSVKSKIDAAQGIHDDVRHKFESYHSLEDLTNWIADIEKQMGEKQTLLSSVRRHLERVGAATRASQVADREYDEIVRLGSLKGKQYEEAEKRNKQGLEIRTFWENSSARYQECLARLNVIRPLIAGLTKKISELYLQRNATNARIDQKSSEIVSCQTQIDKAKACPHCGGKLMVRFDQIDVFDPSVLKKKREEALVEQEELCRALETFDDQLSKLKEDLDPLEKEDLSLSSEVRTLEVLKNNASKYDLSEVDRILAEAQALEPKFLAAKEKKDAADVEFQRVITERPEGVQDNQQTPDTFELEKTISNLKQSHLDFVKEMQDVVSTAEMLKKIESDVSQMRLEEKKLLSLQAEVSYWVKIFPEVKRRLLSSFIPVFEATVNKYLIELQISERVKFSLETATKVGTVKPGFQVWVFDGRHWARFDSYSGGEKSRILVSVGFALRELALRRNGGSGFDFLLCDELLDNLDSTGMSYFFKLLSMIPGQKFIITHTKVDEVSFEVDQKVVVSKENGASTVRVLAA